MKVLIVEDNIDRTRKLRRFFIGCVVDIVDEAQEAIKLLESASYDLILLDHDLGNTEMAPSDEFSGFAVAEYIAQNNLNSDVIIHSCNPVGAARMQQVLPSAIKIPYVSLFSDPRFLAISNADL
jgi:CheY-like chemotaxis protein